MLYTATLQESQQHHLELQWLLLPNSVGVSSLAETPLMRAMCQTEAHQHPEKKTPWHQAFSIFSRL